MRWLYGITDNRHEFEQTPGDSEGQDMPQSMRWQRVGHDITTHTFTKYLLVFYWQRQVPWPSLPVWPESRFCPQARIEKAKHGFCFYREEDV